MRSGSGDGDQVTSILSLLTKEISKELSTGFNTKLKVQINVYQRIIRKAYKIELSNSRKRQSYIHFTTVFVPVPRRFGLAHICNV